MKATRGVLIVLLLVAGLAGSIRAQGGYGDDWRVGTKALREAVCNTLEGQLRALRQRDFDKAYDLAAESIKARFTPAVFAAMIRRGYPALLRHVREEPGVVREDGAGHAVVVVTVIDQLNQRTNFRYILVDEESGWRIEGVVAEGRPPPADT